MTTERSLPTHLGDWARAHPRLLGGSVIVAALALMGIAVVSATTLFSGVPVAGEDDLTPSPSAGDATSSSASAEPSASAAPSASAEATPEPSPEAAALQPGTILRVMVNGLILREEPTTDATAVDTLNAGENVGAVGGDPVQADGLTWYEVRQGPGPRLGWVASGEAGDWLTVVRNGRIAFGCVACADGQPAMLTVEPDGSGQGVLLDYAAFAVWSPDGTYLATWHATGNEPQIVVLGGDGPGRFTVGAGAGLAWSPDGTRSVYSRLSPPGLVLIDENGEASDLGTAGGSPQWSSDGTRIAFEAIDCPDCEPGQPIIDPPTGIFLVTPPATSAELLVRGYGADWSPDGDTIAFGRLDYEGDFPWSFLQVPAAGGEPEPLPGVPDEAAIHGFDWSPDGTRVAFGGPDGIVVADADGSDPLLVASHQGQAMQNPRWSPDGRLVLYEWYDPGGAGVILMVVSSDGTDAHTVIGAPTIAAADWQPLLMPLP